MDLKFGAIFHLLLAVNHFSFANTSLSQDINAFDNCHFLLISIGRRTIWEHHIPKILHPVQLSHPEALLTAPFPAWTLETRNHRKLPPLPMLKFLPQFQPIFSKSPLQCKLLVVQISTKSISWNDIEHVLGHIDESVAIVAGRMPTSEETEEQRYDSYEMSKSETFFRKCVALVYLPGGNRSEDFNYRHNFHYLVTKSRNIFNHYGINYALVKKPAVPQAYEDKKSVTRNIVHICLRCIEDTWINFFNNNTLQPRLLLDNEIKSTEKFLAWRKTSHFEESIKTNFISFNPIFESKYYPALINLVLKSLIFDYLGINVSQLVKNLPNTAGIQVKFKHPSENELSDMEHEDNFFGDLNLVHPNFYHIFWTNTSLSFATCSPILSYVTFSNFLTPFDFWTWGGVALTITTLTIFLKLVAKRFMFFHLLAALLENVSESADTPKLMLWAFASFILSNLYKSIVTNDLTAPISAHIPSTLEEMVAHHFQFVDIDPSRGNSVFEVTPNSKLTAYIQQEVISWGLSHHLKLKDHQTFGHFRGEKLERMSFQALLHYRKCFQDYNVRRKHHRSPHCTGPGLDHYLQQFDFNETVIHRFSDVVNNHSTIKLFLNTDSAFVQDTDDLLEDIDKPDFLKKITYCEKSAIVSWTDKIHLVVRQLFGTKSSITQRHYKILPKTILHRRQFVVVSKFAWNLVSGVISGIVESGIYSKWVEFLDSREVPKRPTNSILGRAETQFHAQSIASNLSIIFFTLLIGLTASSAVLVYESVKFANCTISKIKTQLRRVLVTAALPFMKAITLSHTKVSDMIRQPIFSKSPLQCKLSVVHISTKSISWNDIEHALRHVDEFVAIAAAGMPTVEETEEKPYVSYEMSKSKTFFRKCVTLIYLPTGNIPWNILYPSDIFTKSFQDIP
ncbi:hypothetical protein Fcan01_11781 [Folsomia candida]|uniref:Uncharacterized protein n=1 Tax=Folsomia candida TaxID=158441 RepID=A0A226EBH2_FOLCA|nr:hypothetical protein Fcan01_11781 [Folsomia candida]